MTEKLTKKEIKNIAAQLRKPDGEDGIKIGKMMNEGNLAMNLHTIAVLNPQENDNILEIGMGNGMFIKNIVTIDSSIKYTGCDYSEVMVKIASENNQEFIKKGNVNFIHSNVQELPFENNSFNKIFTINTFYFWDNHNLVVNELKRVLEKDGILTISVRPKRILKQYPVTNYGFAMFGKNKIIELLTSNGFTYLNSSRIKEPKQLQMGEEYKKETLILNFTKQATSS